MLFRALLGAIFGAILRTILGPGVTLDVVVLILAALEALLGAIEAASFGAILGPGVPLDVLIVFVPLAAQFAPLVDLVLGPHCPNLS
ncbi:MAG TPA: hypothetical protein VFA78_07095 [Chloroflexota bacterium]|nr:hypothetical protein [Chloroflexota bacterium]